jgi:hypothetical protein
MSSMKTMRIVGAVTIVAMMAAPACSSSDPVAAQPVDATTLVTLDRTECFGACPSYSLTLDGSGAVSYQGRRFVKVVGVASAQVPVSVVQALVDEMVRANFFNLSVPETCAEGIATDGPTATTSLTLAGRSHTVAHYHGNRCAPAALGSIEDDIDVAAGSATWVACDTSSGYCPP